MENGPFTSVIFLANLHSETGEKNQLAMDMMKPEGINQI